MLREKTSILITILFCLFIFPVKFKNLTILSYVYIYGIPTCYLIFYWKLVQRIKKKQIEIIGLAVLLVFLSILYPTLHETDDYSYVKVATFIFRKLVIYVFLGCILVKKYRDRASMEHFMYYYALTHAIYVIGTLLLVFILPLKEVWFSVFDESIKSGTLLESYGYTFRIGWQGFAGYRVTLHCTFSCIFLLYLQYNADEKFRMKELTFMVLYGLCLLGNMFYGRIGLLLTAVVSLITLFVWNRRKFSNILKFIIGGIFLIGCIYLLRDIPIISKWYKWMSTPIINLLTTGSFNNYSVDRLSEMLFMPDVKTILWGDGYFVYDNHYYMQTDSGIMRSVLFWGIIGTFVSYGMTVCSIMYFKKKNWLLCWMLLGTFMVFEYKGDVYYEFVALLLGISFVDTIRDVREKEDGEKTNDQRYYEYI